MNLPIVTPATYINLLNYSDNLISDNEGLQIRYLQNSNSIVALGKPTCTEPISSFKQLTDKIDDHFLTSGLLSCFFQFSGVNGTSVKLLFNLLKKLEKFSAKGNQIIIHWMIDKHDDHTKQLGLDLRNIINLDIRITHKPTKVND